MIIRANSFSGVMKVRTPQPIDVQPTLREQPRDTRLYESIETSDRGDLLFSPSPFAAPNSRSTLKFHHSLLFTLLLINPHATLPHGRPSPGPNLEAPSPSNRRSAPSPTTNAPPLTAHCPFFRLRELNSFASYHIHPTPAVSCDYALFAQRRAAIPPIFNGFRTLSIARAVYPLCRAFPALGCSDPVNSCVCIGLPPLCRPFALFTSLVSFVFNSLRPLFQKHPGWGVA